MLYELIQDGFLVLDDNNMQQNGHYNFIFIIWHLNVISLHIFHYVWQKLHLNGSTYWTYFINFNCVKCDMSIYLEMLEIYYLFIETFVTRNHYFLYDIFTMKRIQCIHLSFTSEFPGRIQMNRSSSCIVYYKMFCSKDL